MSEFRPLYLNNDAAKKAAIRQIELAPLGMVAEVKTPPRTIDQNSLLHALIGKISRNIVYGGQLRSIDYWKDIFAYEWMKEYDYRPELALAFDRTPIVMSISTSKLIKNHFSQLIEIVYDSMAKNLGIEIRQVVNSKGKVIGHRVFDANGIEIIEIGDRINVEEREAEEVQA